MEPLANIGPKGVLARRTSGGILLALGLLAGALLGYYGAPLPWFLAPGAALWLGVMGLFQARGKT